MVRDYLHKVYIGSCHYGAQDQENASTSRTDLPLQRVGVWGDDIVYIMHEYIYVRERCEQLAIVTQDVPHAQV